tara:strand:- start:14293 stop:15420 length:1128 start_codon:yes stop_codon:yes gene_type:complete
LKPFGIILLASERSGSNLLRTLLGNHSDISAPVAPHLIKIFYPIKHYYSDLHSPKNNKCLFNDMMEIVNHPFSDWKLKLDYKNINLLSTSSVVKMMDSLYMKEAERNQKSFYCSKGINTFRYINQIRYEVPNMRFVHLVRDPRDVVASWMQRSSSLSSSYDAILQWKKQQKMLIKLRKDHHLNCISIKYEDLINDSEKTMNKLLSTLSLTIDEKCYKTNSKNKESQKSEYWKNLSRPILAKNTNKFKEQLCEEDIFMIETIAKEEMRIFDYSPSSSQNWKLNKVSVNHIVKQRNQRKEKAKKDIGDTNHLLKSKQALIKSIITHRKKQYHKTLNIFERLKAFMRLNLQVLIKKSILQHLGNFRVTFLLRNLANRK